MALDIITISVTSSILTTILTNLFIWLNRVFLLKLLRDTLRWFRLLWGHFWIAKSSKRIIRAARAAALKFCLQAIPASKEAARDIKRKEIISTFSHYQNNDTWIEALIKAGEFMGGEEAAVPLNSEGFTPDAIKFSSEELTCWIHIGRNDTHLIYTSQNQKEIPSEDSNENVNAIVKIPGLNEFIKLLERVGLKMVEPSDIYKQLHS